ncbi:hypothetical protein HAX54_043664, partial [Datura stramonium]|nr:hypothetical protein [Datura stramonium]
GITREELETCLQGPTCHKLEHEFHGYHLEGVEKRFPRLIGTSVGSNASTSLRNASTATSSRVSFEGQIIQEGKHILEKLTRDFEDLCRNLY